MQCGIYLLDYEYILLLIFPLHFNIMFLVDKKKTIIRVSHKYRSSIGYRDAIYVREMIVLVNITSATVRLILGNLPTKSFIK